MKREKFTVGLRNKLATLAMDMDCCAAVNTMTEQEREFLQTKLRGLVQYIDNKITLKK